MKSVKRTMFYSAAPSVFIKARFLRLNMTEAEEFLWSKLSNNQLNGFRFKAQHPINKFIADFYCHKAKLVIEVDGEVHNKVEVKEYDINREAAIREFGITIIRFTNEEVFSNIEDVLSKIKQHLEKVQ